MSSELFETTRRWGRWGDEDDRGALNLLTPERVTRAAGLVRDGVTVRCGRPLATAPAVDNPNPALHHMIASTGATSGVPSRVTTARWISKIPVISSTSSGAVRRCPSSKIERG